MIALHSHCNRYENSLPYFLKQLTVPVLTPKRLEKWQFCQCGAIRQPPTRTVVVWGFFGTVLAIGSECKKRRIPKEIVSVKFTKDGSTPKRIIDPFIS